MAAPKAFVIGRPVAHSRSPLIHGHWLRELGLPGSYDRIEVAPEALPAFLRGFAERGFVGGNVTVPHKEAVAALAHALSPAARRLGAANTLTLDENGRVVGDNTDGPGFLASLADAAGAGWRDGVREAFVLGAGGAARAIVAALLDAGLDRIVVASRNPARAEPLRAFDPARVALAPWPEPGARLPPADLVVNTTTRGMNGIDPLDLDLAALPPHALVADIVYVPLETALLARARARGLVAVDGLGMLLHQAAPGFEAWFGQRPTVTPALRALIVADIERA